MKDVEKLSEKESNGTREGRGINRIEEKEENAGDFFRNVDNWNAPETRIMVHLIVRAAKIEILFKHC